MKDTQNRVLAVSSITPIVGNNTTEGTGTGVDLAGCEGAQLIAQIGVSGDTLSGSVYLTVGWQESDVEGSGYTDIVAADLTGGNDGVVIDDAAEDAVVVQRGYVGSKRYVRAYIAFTGTHTNGTPISALVVKHYLRHQPPTITP